MEKKKSIEEIRKMAIDGKEEIEQSLEERSKQLKAVAKELGISEEEIENLSEIDLEQKIQDEEVKGDEGQEKDDEEDRTISEKQKESIKASGLNELDVNAQVDSRGTTLASALNLEEYGYSKVMIVHAHQLTDNGESREDIKFGIVGVKSDGSMEKVPTDKLRMYRGGNNEIVQMNNPQSVEVKNNDVAFEVVGTDRKLVIDQEGTYGRANVYLSKTSRDNEGNIAQKVQDTYDGTERTDVEMRDLYSSYHGNEQMEQSFHEAKKHEEAGCKNISVDEVDGDSRTGHVHGDDEIIKEIADKCRVDEKEALRYYEIVIQENGDGKLTEEEMVDKAQDIAARESGAPARDRNV